MKLKPIPYQSGFVFVDESITIKGIDPSLYLPHAVAQHNLNLEGIPHVDVGELEWLDKIQPNYDKKESYQHGFHDAIQVVKDYYQANKKEFTEDDILGAMEYGIQLG